MHGLLNHLIPVKDFVYGFTTCEHISHPNLEGTELADKPLGVHKTFSKTAHNLVEPPTSSNSPCAPPRIAWEAVYPVGSINPAGQIPGGFGFYLAGPPAFASRLETATEAIFSYRMMLQDHWAWVKGGKLPGICKSNRLLLFGGVGGLSYGCTGGRQDQRCQCFNIRPMWRPKAVGEMYTYLPMIPENSRQLAAVPPRSIENSDYGFSVGRGAFYFDRAVGEWAAIAFRIKLNDVGMDNGELQLWVNGISVIDVGGLILRESEDSKIKGMHFQTFFGGHGDEWASPKDQRAWFSDVTGAILR